MRKLLALTAVVAVMGAQRARADEYEQDPAAQQMAEAQQDAQVSPAVFEGQLGPYGQWIPDSRYGDVFYPNVPANWRPYLYGHWAWTSYGWTWVSDEPFGWAVYHYGRWWFNPAMQRWGWVPGYEWAPAWVVWRFGASSVGWAPLYVGYDAWVDTYPVYLDQWVYVPCEHFYGAPVYHYAYPVSYAANCYHETHSVHGYVGATGYGPPPTYVAAHTAIPVRTTPVVHSAVPPTGGVHGSGPIAVYQPPHTGVYNPTRPSPTPIRGPGAAHTPVVAPPSTHVPVVAGNPGSTAPSRSGVPGGAHGAGSIGGAGRPGLPGGVAGAGSPSRPGLPGSHGSTSPGSVPVVAGGRPGQVQVPGRIPGGNSASTPATPSNPGVHLPVVAGARPGQVQVPGRIPGGSSGSNPGTPSNPGNVGSNPRPGGGRVPVSLPSQTANTTSPSRFGYPQYTPLRPPGYVKDPHTPVTPSTRSFNQPAATAQRPTYAQPTYASQRTYSAPTYPVQQRSYTAPSYAAPRSYAAQQRTYSAPSYPAQRSYSAPSFGGTRTVNRTPSYTTARSYSAPSGGFRAAAPQRSFGSFGGGRAMPTLSSAPVQHRSSSGGGSHSASARRR